MEGKRSIWKKLAIIFGALFVLLGITAVVLPMVVDVDKYRPQIVERINQEIDGKFDLGKLSLSLWGQIRVDIEGLKLTDSKGKTVLAVQDAYFHLPLFSIFSGSPLVSLNMKSPVLNIVKDKGGQLNVMKLVTEKKAGTPQTHGKSTARKAESQAQTEQKEAAKQPKKSTPSKKQDAKEEMEIPGIVAAARFGTEMRYANVRYQDLATGLDTQIKDLNLIVKNLSLSRPTELELWANLDTKLGKELTVRGPAKLEGRAETTVQDGKLHSIAAQFDLDLDDLAIVMPGSFQKDKGVAMNAVAKFKVSPEAADIENFKMTFVNAEVTTSGKVTHLQGNSPVMNLSVKSNVIQLAPWAKLLPKEQQMDFDGTATLQASTKGPLDRLRYEADLKVTDMTVEAEGLKAEPKMNLRVQVETDKIKDFLFTMAAPENDLRIQGNVSSFTRPYMRVAVTSKGMNLDQLLKTDPSKVVPPGKAPPKKETSWIPVKTAVASESTGTPAAQAQDDFDALLDPLRTNPVLANASADLSFKIDSIQSYGVKMEDIISRLSIRDLVATLSQFQMKLWKGKIEASASSNLKPKMPTYRFRSELTGLDLSEAVKSQFTLLKNTIYGIAKARLEGGGSSFNPDAAKKNLNMKGSLRIDEARFATVDVSKMASEAINQSIDRLDDKIAALKGKQVKLGSGASVYDYVASSFQLSKGRFSAPDFVAKAKANRGIDLSGKTTVNILTYALSADWMVIDTYNMLKVRNYAQFLAKGDGPVKFPVNVGCTVFEPCYDYKDTAGYLADVALGNAKQAAVGKAKKQLKKKLKPKLKGLRKKLFGG